MRYKDVAMTAETAIRESEAKYRLLFECSHDAILIMRDGRIEDCNMKAAEIFGLGRKEIVGKAPWDLSPACQPDGTDSRKRAARIIDSVHSGGHEFFVWRHVRRDGTPFDAEVSLGCYEMEDEKLIQAVVRDISERKKAEEILRRREQELELKSRSLEEMNTALRVLLRQRENDKNELGKRILSNLRGFALPYLGELKASRLPPGQMAWVELAEKSLHELMSPFLESLTAGDAKLTPKEIHVANLIKNGKSTKEIAELLNVSPSAIKLHRFHIRKKLGLNNEKIGLQSYLLSLFKG